ncbi:1,5-anhydro-D-fructose reductase-like [Bacillus rossius redtenbacheri]|uniref:1,5-anhydro-D-fructose reductase-like n=1 Tax=Bacillus rossius redtenbacheri TaxID=93214 RepID=UPI002FDEFE65
MTDRAPALKLNNNREMPIIGLGTFMAASEVIEPMVDAALEAGYRFIDTGYWHCNEEAIGSALNKWLRSGRITREELFIATKMPSTANRAELVEESLKKSLEALQLSYIDMYILHFPFGYEYLDLQQRLCVVDNTTDIVSIWKAMEQQVEAGRTLSIGLASFNARQLKRIVKAARIPPAVLMIELNVYLQQKELVGFCKALDVAVCAYAPLGSPDLPLLMKMMGFDSESIPALNALSDPVVLSIAEKHSKTASQVLLRHIVQRGIAAVPKSMHPSRIKENFQVFDFELDDDDMDRLYVLDKGRRARMYNTSIFPE